MLHTLKTAADFGAVYDAPNPHSLLKETDRLSADYHTFVEASPFIVLSSVGAQDTDVSPKSDVPGFVRILNGRLLAIPNRSGNSCTDDPRNIAEDGRVLVPLIVPSMDETLHMNGTATISADLELPMSSAVQSRLPYSVVPVQMQTVYFHYSKALLRSELWECGIQGNKPAAPITGRILRYVSGGTFNGNAYDRELSERLKTTLY